jgi:hypothetical protein
MEWSQQLPQAEAANNVAVVNNHHMGVLVGGGVGGVGAGNVGGVGGGGGNNPLLEADHHHRNNGGVTHLGHAGGSTVTMTPTIKNHSVTHYKEHLYCFGGYDGRRNHQSLLLFNLHNQTWSIPSSREVAGTPPPGRNGHTATLAQDQIIILGGWLGSGPLAASDLFVLDVSEGPSNLRWYQPQIKGQPPGPCNMHSADYIPHLHRVYVFRGGNGREYLNDLHSLDCKTFEWTPVPSTGERPQARANHSSALLQNTRELVIFGGWNGQERLNDIHLLDIDNSTWSKPHIRGELPMPRAGMTLSASRDRLYLFGGSGTSSKCFCDLQIFDRDELKWLDVNAFNDSSANTCGSINATGNEQGGGGVDRSIMHVNANDDGGLQADVVGGVARGGDVLGGAGGGVDHLGKRILTSSKSLSSTVSYNYLSNVNPNDEDATNSITLLGRGPGQRAGHSATAVGRFIYIFGGSCGPDYLNDFFVLDTDPSPTPQITEPNSLQLFMEHIHKFVNDEEFSDVTFVLENGTQRIYGHKMILSLVSDCFRAMFTTGFRESTQREIEIPNCSYGAFYCMMEYIYTGRVPQFAVLRRNTGTNQHYNNRHFALAQSNESQEGGADNPDLVAAIENGGGADDDPMNHGMNNNNNDYDNSMHNGNALIIHEENLTRAVELLELADQFFLDHLKQCCEGMLQPAVWPETCDSMLAVAQKCNAHQLEQCCRHFMRNDQAGGQQQQSNDLGGGRRIRSSNGGQDNNNNVQAAEGHIDAPPAVAVRGRMDTDPIDQGVRVRQLHQQPDQHQGQVATQVLNQQGEQVDQQQGEGAPVLLGEEGNMEVEGEDEMVPNHMEMALDSSNDNNAPNFANRNGGDSSSGVDDNSAAVENMDMVRRQGGQR